jgi:hypothetical protein
VSSNCVGLEASPFTAGYYVGSDKWLGRVLFEIDSILALLVARNSGSSCHQKVRDEIQQGMSSWSVKK